MYEAEIKNFYPGRTVMMFGRTPEEILNALNWFDMNVVTKQDKSKMTRKEAFKKLVTIYPPTYAENFIFDACKPATTPSYISSAPSPG